jgi:hypothetical protein
MIKKPTSTIYNDIFHVTNKAHAEILSSPIFIRNVKSINRTLQLLKQEEITERVFYNYKDYGFLKYHKRMKRKY